MNINNIPTHFSPYYNVHGDLLVLASDIRHVEMCAHACSVFALAPHGDIVKCTCMRLGCMVACSCLTSIKTLSNLLCAHKCIV